MLEALFNPSSVAVIGASKEPGKVGHEVLRNVIASGYKGEVYPVNPKADVILGIKCYPSVLEVPEDIDLGVVAVPAAIVPQIAEEAGRKGVKALVIISAGFRETGREGTELEKRVVDVCRKYGVRVLGPNCLGVMDTYTPINASFAAETPLRGNIAFVSQSGALCAAVLDWSLEEEIGFSKFVSLGNGADIDEADLMSALAEDEDTEVILVYLEGVKDGEKFMKVARGVTRRKPVIVVKSGVTDAGARAVSSHTGSIAGSDLAFDVAFRQAGIIRAFTIEEVFDLAETFSTQPVPKGPNLAIVTNAGGPGILATDACERHGLKMAPISTEIVERLRERLPPEASFHNPVDILGDATAWRYRFALETILKSPDVHSVLVILTPQAMTDAEETARAIVEVRKKFQYKPIVTAFLGGEMIRKAVRILTESRVPSYLFPERAVYSLSTLVKYGEYVMAPPLEPAPHLKINRGKVAAIFKKVREENRVTLTGSEAIEAAKACGVSAPTVRLATTAKEAVLMAEDIGYPVVLKIESPQILHKTDIGGVKLNIDSAEGVKKAFSEIVENAHRYMPKASLHGVNVQKMIPQGKEMIIGAHRDIVFGPLIMFGLGGIYVDFLRDVSFRLAPLTREMASDMIRETRAYTILRGIRGEPKSDIDSIVDVLLRVSQLVTDFNEINEMDINPLFVYEDGKGCLALDVKITIRSP